MVWYRMFKELHCSRHSSYGMKSSVFSASWRCWFGQEQMAPHGTCLDLAELALIAWSKWVLIFKKGFHILWFSFSWKQSTTQLRNSLSPDLAKVWQINLILPSSLRIVMPKYPESGFLSPVQIFVRLSLDFRKNRVCLNCLPSAPSNLDYVFFFKDVGQTCPVTSEEDDCFLTLPFSGYFSKDQSSSCKRNTPTAFDFSTFIPLRNCSHEWQISWWGSYRTGCI